MTGDRFHLWLRTLALLPAVLLALTALPAQAQSEPPQAQLGPRPFYLVDDLDPGPLKDRLKACEAGPFQRSSFSIAHRGAPLQFPEHTREAYMAGARMGAGIMECDVTFTRDRELVCRHDQCDLHTSTDILSRPELAKKCSVPFSPADPATGRKAQVKCCTSDLTLAEFRQLRGKMDGANENAISVVDYMKGTPGWRTDLYATTGTLMTHKESIALFKSFGVKFTPELKQPRVLMPYDGTYTQNAYAQQMIDDYKDAGIAPSQVFPQSFLLRDVLYWIKEEPAFGVQAVLLDERLGSSAEKDKDFDVQKPETWKPGMKELADAGVKILAPALPMMVTLDEKQQIVPSRFALEAKAAGLKLIGWSLERSGTLTDGGGYYYSTIKPVIRKPSDTYRLLDVLARDVGVIGVFSDWPATTTFYANCMGLK
ncbi:glycerophosphoryl diester phosphodiesterase [Azorhizobium oxalatiphilum]|uniref:glycerophosphodiester phosphodiesterase n=1 Tax=Azorhizobium oxalatiphilum TaxID=980631 RepID=A0A917C7V0_9HYPH|nr:glycerophosphodiester phosphodiesterase family protein [Azorhizobium oxalatiphilum]GGF71971.1 glycerophosphoryl diester phosphodiesterase [Azorhizobium oxalatiphilum]